jgi:hypothetical protein
MWAATAKQLSIDLHHLPHNALGSGTKLSVCAQKRQAGALHPVAAGCHATLIAIATMTPALLAGL